MTYARPDSDVGVIGIAQTIYETAKSELSLQDLIFGVASEALEDAGIQRDEIDSVVIASQDVTDGRGISNMQNAAPAGAYLKDEIRVAADGLYALALAYLQIRAGRSDAVLVISWSKPSETSLEAISAAEFDPFWDQQLPLSETIALGLQAQAVAARYSRARLGATMSGVRDRAHGAHNGKAHLRRPIEAAAFEASPHVSWPLREIDLSPPSDGSCALVLATKDRFPSKRRLAHIVGIGWATDPYLLGQRDLATSPSLRDASRRAYAMAGLADVNGASLLEVSARSTYQELIVLSELGVAAPTDVTALLEGGETNLGGRLPVNPSGGLRCAYPAVASGLVRATEIALQLGGRADGHQVEHATVGIAHGSYGQALQSNVVVVMATSA